jgi:hypothetical protein
MSALEQRAWAILTTRYGADIREPTFDQLRSALAEVYHEDHPSMTEGDYAQHPNAWLRYGFDTGPMYILNVYRSRTVYLSQWADSDYENQLAPEAEKIDVAEPEAYQLWERLATGRIDEVKAWGWDAI